MSHLKNWKGELQTFCARYFCSTPKYKPPKQLLSEEWESECTVKFSNKLLLITNNDSEQIITTTSIAKKKKESERLAAELMMNKLNRILSPHIAHIKHSKHLKTLKSKSQNELNINTLESLFSDGNVNNSVFMQQLIQSHPEQWISLDDIVNVPIFSELFGKYGWNNDQYTQIKEAFCEMVVKYSNTLEISTDKQYIRRKELFDIYEKNESKSQELRLKGNELFAEKKYDEAVVEYSDAMKYNEFDYRIAMNLSLTYLKMKDYDKALSFANKAIRQKPYFAKPYARAALVLFEMKQTQKAIATIEHSIQYQPNNKQWNEYRNKWEKTLYPCTYK